jgi:hypothetical protein
MNDLHLGFFIILMKQRPQEIMLPPFINDEWCLVTGLGERFSVWQTNDNKRVNQLCSRAMKGQDKEYGTQSVVIYRKISPTSEAYYLTLSTL